MPWCSTASAMRPMPESWRLRKAIRIEKRSFSGSRPTAMLYPLISHKHLLKPFKCTGLCIQALPQSSICGMPIRRENWISICSPFTNEKRQQEVWITTKPGSFWSAYGSSLTTSPPRPKWGSPSRRVQPTQTSLTSIPAGLIPIRAKTASMRFPI